MKLKLVNKILFADNVKVENYTSEPGYIINGLPQPVLPDVVIFVERLKEQSLFDATLTSKLANDNLLRLWKDRHKFNLVFNGLPVTGFKLLSLEKFPWVSLPVVDSKGEQGAMLIFKEDRYKIYLKLEEIYL